MALLGSKAGGGAGMLLLLPGLPGGTVHTLHVGVQKGSPRPERLLHLALQKPGRQARLASFLHLVCAFGRAGSSLLSGLSSGCGERGYSPAPLASPAADHGRCAHGLQRVWPTGLAVSRRAGSSRIGGQNRVSFIGRRILYRPATREAPPTLPPFVPRT